MRFVVRFGRFAIIIAVFIVSACGVGNTQSRTITSSSSINFTAASPDAGTPPPQTITVSVSSGTVSLSVLHSGAAIAATTYSLSGTTAQIAVIPASPSVLGAGVFNGTITVTGYTCADPGCSNLVSGNSQVITVGYQIPPIVRFVAPYAAIAGTSANVIIRGRGFQQFTVQNVLFGSNPATTFSVVSDTEIEATYPSTLVANTIYPVQIVVPTSPGAITSLANLAAVSVPAFSSAALPYPVGTTPLAVKQILYDAQRQALLVAVDTGGGEVLRYPYASSWGSPAIAPVTNLSDIALSTGGQRLLALWQQGITQLDPSTLVQNSVSPGPSFTSGTFLKNLAVANDGNAIVTTGISGSDFTPIFFYAARSPGFTQVLSPQGLDNSIPGASADGSLVALEQGDPTLTSAPGIYQYVASSGTFTAPGTALNQNFIAPALDRAATRIVLNGTDVYDAYYNFLGTLPSTTLAVVVSPDASYAYTFDSVASNVLAFDLNSSPGGGAFQVIGSVALATNPGTGVKMTISPDGNTLFLAGSNQIVVQSPP